MPWKEKTLNNTTVKCPINLYKGLWSCHFGYVHVDKDYNVVIFNATGNIYGTKLERLPDAKYTLVDHEIVVYGDD